MLNDTVKIIYVCLLLLVLGTINESKAQFNSINEYSGSWADSASWVEGTAPSATAIKNSIINIQGFITRSGNLVLEKTSVLTIKEYDTLVVSGDFSLAKDCDVYVETGAVFIVLGNYTSAKDLVMVNDGMIVIDGTVTVAKGAGVTNNGEIYSSDPAINSKLGLDGTPGSNMAGTIEDLNDNGDAGDQAIYDYVTGGGAGTLPVELAYFELKKVDEHIHLNWATQSELNFDYFEILQSKDGVNYEFIGRVDGNGTSNRLINYEFRDYNPSVGKNYYLLKAVDLDGSVEEKGIKVIYLKGSLNAVVAYPNPVQNGKLSVRHFNIDEGEIQAKVYHTSGKLIISKVLTGYDPTIDFPEELPKGIYILSLEQAEAKIRKTIVIR